jgi:hypothetical protein
MISLILIWAMQATTNLEIVKARDIKLRIPISNFVKIKFPEVK